MFRMIFKTCLDCYLTGEKPILGQVVKCFLYFNLLYIFYLQVFKVGYHLDGLTILHFSSVVNGQGNKYFGGELK